MQLHQVTIRWRAKSIHLCWLPSQCYWTPSYINEFRGNSGALVLQHGQSLEQIAVSVENSSSFSALFWQKKFMDWKSVSCFICAPCYSWTQHIAPPCRGWDVRVFPPQSCLTKWNTSLPWQNSLCVSPCRGVCASVIRYLMRQGQYSL